MNYNTGILSLAAAFCVLASAGVPALAQQAQRLGPLKVVAGEIVFMKNQWVLSGNRPQLYSLDGQFSVRADRIVVDFHQSSGGIKVSKDLVKSATATGNVQFKTRKPGQSAEGSAPRAEYTQADGGKLVLSGGVEATIVDPNLEEPTPIKADRVTVWLAPPDDAPRFKIEGSPATITVTPKDKNKQEQPAAKN